MAPPGLFVRGAEPADNDALRAIAASCPMEGDITIGVSRDPDFFQLNRLEGSTWRVGVAELDGRVVGCVMAAYRRAYVHGVEQPTLYAGDLKVHPSVRGTGVANALTEWVRDVLVEMGGRHTPVPVLLTILGGNRSMERRTDGRGGVPRYIRFATMRAFSIPLLFGRTSRDTSLRICIAQDGDIDEMVALWERVAPSRQFAPVFTARGVQRWIADAPGLDISSYRLARDRRGRLVGFLAWWDQTKFKQLRVQRYSRRMRAARMAINATARLTGGVPLPGVGAALRYCTAVHVCVRSESPAVLRTLLRSTHAELRAARYAFATIALDIRDPLCAALDGLFAQPTDAHAYVCTTAGEYAGPPLADRPLHYEIAFV